MTPTPNSKCNDKERCTCCNSCDGSCALCKYHSTPISSPSGWEEKLEKSLRAKCPYSDCYRVKYRECPTHGSAEKFLVAIKSFIKSTLLSSRQKIISEILKEVEGLEYKMGVDEYLPLVKAWNGTDFDVPFDQGYGKAISEVAKIISEYGKNRN